MYGYLFCRGRGLVSGFLTLWDSFFLVHMTPSNFWEKEKTDVRVCQTVIHIIYNHHFTLVAKSRCKLRKTDIFILRWWRAHLCESRHLKRNAPGLKDLFLPRTTYKVLWGWMFRVLLCQSISDGKSIGYRRLCLLAICWRLCFSLPKKGDTRVRYKRMWIESGSVKLKKCWIHVLD